MRLNKVEMVDFEMRLNKVEMRLRLIAALVLLGLGVVVRVVVVRVVVRVILRGLGLGGGGVRIIAGGLGIVAAAVLRGDIGERLLLLLRQ